MANPPTTRSIWDMASSEIRAIASRAKTDGSGAYSSVTKNGLSISISANYIPNSCAYKGCYKDKARHLTEKIDHKFVPKSVSDYDTKVSLSVHSISFRGELYLAFGAPVWKLSI